MILLERFDVLLTPEVKFVPVQYCNSRCEDGCNLSVLEVTLIYLLAPFSPKSLKYFGHAEAIFFFPGTWNNTGLST